MSKVDNRTDAATGRIQLRPFLLTGLYGLGFGLLSVIAFLPSNESIVLRLTAVIALAGSYIMTARGAFSRWMDPADKVIVGSPLSRLLGGPGYPRLTPANMAYIGVLLLGACVPIRLIPAILAAEYQSIVLLWLYGGIGALCLLYGLIRQPRREA